MQSDMHSNLLKSSMGYLFQNDFRIMSLCSSKMLCVTVLYFQVYLQYTCISIKCHRTVTLVLLSVHVVQLLLSHYYSLQLTSTQLLLLNYHSVEMKLHMMYQVITVLNGGDFLFTYTVHVVQLAQVKQQLHEAILVGIVMLMYVCVTFTFHFVKNLNVQSPDISSSYKMAAMRYMY